MGVGVHVYACMHAYHVSVRAYMHMCVLVYGCVFDMHMYVCMYYSM